MDRQSERIRPFDSSVQSVEPQFTLRRARERGELTGVVDEIARRTVGRVLHSDISKARQQGTAGQSLVVGSRDNDKCLAWAFGRGDAARADRLR